MHKSTMKKGNKILKDKPLNAISPEIVLKSILTEKSVNLELTKNMISFIVPNWANKTSIRYSIMNVFKVKSTDILGINTITISSKEKSFQNRKYYTTAYKKAIVRLKSLQPLSEVL